jgi:polar amino acid transport system substrate-binding protein
MVILLVMLSLLVATWAAGLAGAASPPPQESENVYTVQAADSLSDLADKYYGNPGLWPAIWLATNAKAAEDDSFETILNPNALKVGQNLWIPDAEEAAALMAGYLAEKEAVLAAAPKTMRLPDLGAQTVVAVTENAYTPLNFVDPLTGEAVGWDYDAVNEMCRRLDCELDWQIASWDTMIAAVRNGQFDVGMDGITITDERKEQVDFSDPYMVSQQFMLVGAGEDRFATPEEFGADPDLLIGSQTGTTNFYVAVYDVLDGDESNPRIKLFENFGAAVQALIAGDVDMVLMDAASSRGYVGANPDKLALIGEPLGTEEFGFIFTPGSDLVDPVNKALKTMQEDGFLEHLNTRWFFMYDPSSGPAEDTTEESTTEAAQDVTSTEVIQYVPTMPTGEAQDGSCWTSSISVPREGAWRCTVDSSISDPCFALPDDPNAVVCDPNPATGDPGFKMNLTEPLPAPDLGEGSADFLKTNGWMIELADGMVCSFFTGATAPVNGKRISYGCTKEYSIIGDLHPGTVWQAERVDTDNLVAGDEGMTAEETEMVDIRTLWQ